MQENVKGKKILSLKKQRCWEYKKVIKIYFLCINLCTVLRKKL